MTITREQVVDLQPGDVVEISHPEWAGGRIRGPLYKETAWSVCGYLVIRNDGSVSDYLDRGDLTVISRAPHPLYVNHPRTEPVAGDVVRADDEQLARTWLYADPGGSGEWITAGRERGEYDWADRDQLPTRLRLLVDGETGQVVQ